MDEAKAYDELRRLQHRTDFKLIQRKIYVANKRV